MSTDKVAEYGFERIGGGFTGDAATVFGGVRCVSCGLTFPADGSVMRGHASRCKVNPRSHYVPAVCES